MTAADLAYCHQTLRDANASWHLRSALVAVLEDHARLSATVEGLHLLMAEAVRDFHGKSVLFSAPFLVQAENATKTTVGG